MNELVIEKLVAGGQGLTRDEHGRVVFVWNALPGERVAAQYLKKKKDYCETIATEILEASKDRIPPKDPHFLSSAPWQMMAPEAELRWKKNIAAETYSKIGDLIMNADDLEIATDGVYEGYRNKMEFSFFVEDQQRISLALFKRGSHQRIPVDSVMVATKEVNAAAKTILDWVNKEEIPRRGLKSLIVRSSGTHAIAALFIKDELSFENHPALSDTFVGFQLYYSTHKSPASVPTKLLSSTGQNFLEASILGTRLRFGLLSFFQINPPVFELALKDIAAFLDPKQPLVDFYAGVGAIGLPLSRAREKTLLVESEPEAVEFSKQNVKLNQLKHIEAICLPSEKMTGIITPDVQIILDPPRAGLHGDVIATLLRTKPKRIVYLSCNISTQARDLRMLSSIYRPIFTKLYNFFPRTPHIEGLVVLEALA